jgi:hypothetical protein
MTKLSTAAWIAHNLGLGASFGGLLFGKLALNPTLKEIDSEPERGKLLNKAWNRYNLVNAFSVGTAVATWFPGRLGLSGRAIDEQAKNLVRAKDSLLISSVVTGLASIISGYVLSRQGPEGATPIESGTEPAPETPNRGAKLLRLVNVLGNVNLVLIGSISAITTVLSMKAIESTRWSFVSRLLP